MHRRTSTGRASALALALLATPACGDGESDTPDTAVGDVGADAASDAGGDVAVDSGRDVAPGAPDVSPDADVSPDTPPDIDVSPDTPPDTAPDVGGPDGSDADAAEVDTAPTLRAIAGTMESALDGRFTWLDLSVDGAVVETVRVATTATSFVFETMVADGATFSVTVADHPYEGACTLEAADGVVSDDVVVSVQCWQGYLFVTSERRSDRLNLGWVEETEDALTRREVEVRDFGADGIPLTSDDDRISASTFVYPPDVANLDSPVARYRYAGPGPDGAWWTADDLLTNYELRSYVEHRLDEFFDYEGPGDDGEWFTEDDQLSIATADGTFEYDGEGRLVCTYRVGLGSDGILGTDDDPIFGIYEYEYAAHPALDAMIRTELSSFAPGDDSVPCTADDAGRYASTSIVADDGTYWFDYGTRYREIRPLVDHVEVLVTWEKADGTTIAGPTVDTLIGYLSRFVFLGVELPAPFVGAPGDDGEWFTEDDVVTGSEERTAYDDDGNVLVEAVYPDDVDVRGPDGVWLTADDAAMHWTAYTVAEDGTRCAARHTDRGTDGLWDSGPCGNGGDDAFEWVDWQTVDDDGRPVRACRSFAAGDDGLWATADDELTQSHGCVGYTYPGESHAYRTLVCDFGSDRLPFTEDDSRDVYRVTYDAYGFENSEAQLSGPGDDAEWFTEDDTYWAYSEFEFDRSGNMLVERVDGDAGEDGVWFNEDDRFGTEIEGHMFRFDTGADDDG